MDGDGITPLDGDCWDSPEAPLKLTGSKRTTAGDIYVGAVDVPYDGIDANCDGSDDFDADGDGWVPSSMPAFQLTGSKALGQGRTSETAGMIPVWCSKRRTVLIP